MQLTTLLLSLSLAITAFAAPLLTKRQGVYTIDGEPNTEFRLDHDKHGRPIVPEDFPSYDSLPHLQCEAHINYVPRISRKTWQMECPPKILRWKINHNVFESQEMAAEGRAQVELDRQGSVRACIQFPYLPGCKKMLQEDAAIKNEEKEQNEAAAKQAKEQEEKAAAVAKLEKEQRGKAAAERKEKERERKDAAKEKEKVWREKADVAAKKKKEQKEKNAAEKQEKEQGSDGVEPSS